MEKVSDTSKNADSPLVPQYQAGDSLELQMVNADRHVFPCADTITVDIEQVITVTMAPVMLVTINTPTPTRAILKLYDRRFGSSLRDDKRGKHVPCRLHHENEFHSFVRRGEMEAFGNVIQEADRTQMLPPRPIDWNKGPDGQAKYEAALWFMSQEYFKTELKAYNYLKDLQGTIIPRLYASVKLSPTDCPPTSGAHDVYCTVYGILTEFIPGGTLWDLPKSPLAPESSGQWAVLVQRAMDAAYEINKQGIVLEDSSPRNVMFHPSTGTPYIIDFAQCTFKEDIFQVWEEFDLVEEGSTLELDWCEYARITDNPAAIGGVMRIRLEKTLGFTIDIKFPDCSKVLDDAKADSL